MPLVCTLVCILSSELSDVIPVCLESYVCILSGELSSRLHNLPFGKS